MSMEGVNYIEIQGYINSPSFQETRGGHSLYKCRVGVPFTFTDKRTGEVKEGQNYHNVIAWREVAEDMSSYPEGTPVRVYGTLNTRGYDSNCKKCGELEKKYWTDITVGTFVVVEAESSDQQQG